MAENSLSEVEVSGKDIHQYSPEDLKNPVTRRRFLGSLISFVVAGEVATQTSIKTFFNIAGEATKDPNKPSLNKYRPLLPLIIEGKPFRLVGVAHTVQTFLQNQDDIRQRVKKTPFVFLEYFDQEMRDLAIPTTPDSQLFTLTGKYSDTYNAFFGGVGRVCAQEGKDIIVVNPEKDVSKQIEFFLLFGLPAGVKLSKLDILFADVLKEAKTGPVSRRTFLRSLMYLPSAAVWSSWTDLTHKMREALESTGIIDSTLEDSEKANLLGWSLIDWRDLLSARGTAKAMQVYGQQFASGEEAVMFQGEGHNGMQEYIKNPALREAKEKFYFHHNIPGENSIRRYSYSVSQNKWIMPSSPVKY